MSLITWFKELSLKISNIYSGNIAFVANLIINIIVIAIYYFAMRAFFKMREKVAVKNLEDYRRKHNEAQNKK